MKISKIIISIPDLYHTYKYGVKNNPHKNSSSLSKFDKDITSVYKAKLSQFVELRHEDCF